MNEIEDLEVGDSIIMDILSECTEKEECPMDVASISPLCTVTVAASPACNTEDVPHPDSYKFLLTHSKSWQFGDTMCIPHTESVEVYIVDFNSDKVLVKSEIECDFLDEGQLYNIELTVFLCKHCDEQFSEKSSLDKHTKTHILYTCDECDEEFIQHEELVSHMSTHPRRKTVFNCRICCNLFSSPEELVTHQGLRTCKKPFPCLKCDKGYTTKKHLLRHMKKKHTVMEVSHEESASKDNLVITNSKRFPCTKCDKGYTEKNRLTRHMKDKHLEVCDKVRPFSCAKCNEGCASKYLLDIHMKKKHLFEDVINNQH